jgi:hypothetical protein
MQPTYILDCPCTQLPAPPCLAFMFATSLMQNPFMAAPSLLHHPMHILHHAATATQLRTIPTCTEMAVAAGGPCHAIMAPVATDTLADGSRVLHVAAAVGRRMWWLSSGSGASCSLPLLQSSHPVDQGDWQCNLHAVHCRHFTSAP